MHHFQLHRLFDGRHELLFWPVGIPTGLFSWLFISVCLYLIITKANRRPGCLVWVPILQVIPAMETADMSLLWLLILLVPVVGWLIFAVVLGVGLAKARGKDPIWGVLFAFCAPVGMLYLAIA